MRSHGRVDFKLEARPQSDHELGEDGLGLIARNANFSDYPLRASPAGDEAILCRTNAPLLAMRLEVRSRVKISMMKKRKFDTDFLSTALQLLQRGIPCHMLGRKELCR